MVFQNQPIVKGNVKLSVQASKAHASKPNENILNPNLYTHYEVTVLFKNEISIPMGYKEYFHSDGTAKYVPKETVLKIYNYCFSPYAMFMDPSCL